MISARHAIVASRLRRATHALEVATADTDLRVVAARLPATGLLIRFAAEADNAVQARLALEAALAVTEELWGLARRGTAR